MRLPLGMSLRSLRHHHSNGLPPAVASKPQLPSGVQPSSPSAPAECSAPCADTVAAPHLVGRGPWHIHRSTTGKHIPAIPGD